MRQFSMRAGLVLALGLILGLAPNLAHAQATGAISGTATISSVAEQAASAYTQFAPGAFALRVTAGGNAANILASAAAPAGVTGTTSADPIAGATVAGSVLTAFVFPASVTGSLAAASAAPSVVYIADKQPPRTTSPSTSATSSRWPSPPR